MSKKNKLVKRGLASLNETKTIWDSGFKPLKPTVVIDPKLLRVMKFIQNKVGDNEFSILAKGEFKDGVFYVGSEYYIPEQEVTSNSVDYKENIGTKKEDGFNTVVHSHPFAEDSDFSEADEEHINSHFVCSILLNSRGEPIKAILNIPIQNTFIQVEAEEILEMAEDVEVDKKELQKIKEKSYTCYNSYNYKFRREPVGKTETELEEEFEKLYQSRKVGYPEYDYYW